MSKNGAKNGNGKDRRNSQVYAPTHVGGQQPTRGGGQQPTRGGGQQRKSAELSAPITRRTGAKSETARAQWRDMAGPTGQPPARNRQQKKQQPAAARPPQKQQPAAAKQPQKKRKHRRQETILVPIELLGITPRPEQPPAPTKDALRAAKKELNAAKKEKKRRERQRKRDKLCHETTRGTMFSAKNTAGKKDMPQREKRPPMSRRKALSILITMVALSGLLLCGYFVFLLDSVVVEGNEVYSGQSIVELSGLVKNRHMLLCDAEAVKRNIGENPYLRVIEVEKVLPRTIRILVEEREEAAVIRSQGYDVIVDVTGHVLSIGSSSKLDGLLHIYGMGQQGFQINKPIGANEDIQTDTLRTILAQLNALGLMKDVVELNLANPLRVSMQTTEGITIVLGQANDMEEKLLWVKDTLPSLRASNVTAGTLDVNAKGGPIYSPPGVRQLRAQNVDDGPDQEPGQEPDQEPGQAPDQEPDQEPDTSPDPDVTPEPGE